MITLRLIICTIFIFISECLYSQIEYQVSESDNLAIGSYGRIGIDWSFENNGSIGRRLNLNNMGSIGGRLEEQDYFELAPAIGFKPFNQTDSTRIFVQSRLAVFSKSLTLIGNSTTSDLGGLTFSIPELFVAAQNINNTGINVWVGARLYRGPDVHIADHRYFNDHSGQGFGIEYKNTRFAAIFVASSDTNATVPPYFYLNISTGTPSIALRQRTVWTLQQDFNISTSNKVTLLGEYHRMGDAQDSNLPDTLPDNLSYPSDYGLVGGIRLETKFSGMPDSYNRIALRYGSRIANGGDGGLSRSWLTFGAPDSVSRSFKGAYSLSIVDDVLLNFSPKYSLNLYLIYTLSRGGADGNGPSSTYYGREVFNKKEDFTIGLREMIYFNNKFHLLGELHFSQRRDGDNPWARMTKFSLAPTLVPTGEKNYWARPHIRFISSVAFYNKYAQENLNSPYLEFVGAKPWGYFFGIKAEWWLWK